MSNYTIPLKDCLVSLLNNKYESTTPYKDIIADSHSLLFDFDYPIFDNDYKVVLETKFCKRFYNREIGSETFGLFQLRLDELFNTIMPFYNELYKQNLDKVLLLNSDNIRTENTLTKTGTIGNETELESKVTDETGVETESISKNKFSDAPMGNLTNVENESYLTDLRIINDNSESSSSSETNSNSTTTGTQTFNTVDSYVESRIGYAGSNVIEKLNDIKILFFNIDDMILNKCEDLFLKIW